MATLRELERALINADKAGATEDARTLARAIIAMREQQAPAADATPQAKPAAQRIAPEVPGIGETLLIGAGRTFDRVGKGMQQLYYGAKSQFESPSLSSLVTGETPSQAKLRELETAAKQDDALYAPLKEARPWSTAIGESAPAMVIPGAGSANIWRNAGRAALAGAIPGGLEYGTAGERASRAGLGAIAGAVPSVAVGLAKTGKAFIEPLYQGGRDAIAGRTLNAVAGSNAPAVAARLRAAQPMVPGSMPTAGQVAESGGVAALERAAAAANPEAYAQRAMEQASARMNALRGVAKDDAAMAAATAERKTASEALYAQADMGTAPIDATFKSLLQRPQFAAAVAQARKLAKDSGLDDIFFRDAKGQPVALLGQGAHLIKKALDDAGDVMSNSYAGKTAAKTAGGTNEVFQSWLEKSIPEYAAAKAVYAEKSAPINRMQIGQALMDKAAPALSDFGALGRETGATFATAMRNGDALAAKATGFPGARMAQVLTAPEMQAIEGVAKDLARKANAQDLGRGVGSDTFQKLAMNNIAQQSGAPMIVGGLLSAPGVSRATRWLYADADQKMQAKLADTLLSPAATADAMQKAASVGLLANNPKSRKVLQQALLRSGLLAAPTSNGLAND